MPVDVADLLRRSRQANDAFHEAQKKKLKELAFTLISMALSLRHEADVADPEHTDPAWAEDKAPHSEIMAFYNRYLGIPA